MAMSVGAASASFLQWAPWFWLREWKGRNENLTAHIQYWV